MRQSQGLMVAYNICAGVPSDRLATIWNNLGASLSVNAMSAERWVTVIDVARHLG